MSEIMDIRLQHHLAQEFYRQQMLQRIPGTKKVNILKNCISMMDIGFATEEGAGVLRSIKQIIHQMLKFLR